MASLPKYNSFHPREAATEQAYNSLDQLQANKDNSTQASSTDTRAELGIDSEVDELGYNAEQADDSEGSLKSARVNSDCPELPELFAHTRATEGKPTPFHSGRDYEISESFRETVTRTSPEHQAFKPSQDDVKESITCIVEHQVNNTRDPVPFQSDHEIESSHSEVKNGSGSFNQAHVLKGLDSTAVRPLKVSQPSQIAVTNASSVNSHDSTLTQPRVKHPSQSQAHNLPDGAADSEDNNKLDSAAAQDTKMPTNTLQDWVHDHVVVPDHSEYGELAEPESKLKVAQNHVPSRADLREYRDLAQNAAHFVAAVPLQTELDNVLPGGALYEKGLKPVSTNPSSVSDATTSDTSDCDSIFDASESELDLSNRSNPLIFAIMKPAIFILILSFILSGLISHVRALMDQSSVAEGTAKLNHFVTVLRYIPSDVMYILASLIPHPIFLSIVAIMVSATVLINKNKQDLRKDVSKQSKVYYSDKKTAHYLYVMGSGGHTTEMLGLMKMTLNPTENSHRRYLITDGDQHSVNLVRTMERELRLKCPNGEAGTYDRTIITRARSVYQSWFTTPITSIQSAYQILKSLTRIPKKRMPEYHAELFRYPDVIVTTGPGTGFIVALVAFILKTLWLVPRNSMKVAFIETWARHRGLSLTGKLIYRMNLANIFVAQSKELADEINVPCIGNVNEAWAKKGNSSLVAEAIGAAHDADNQKDAKEAERKADQKAAKRVRLAKEKAMAH